MVIASAISVGFAEIILSVWFKHVLFDRTLDSPSPPYVWCKGSKNRWEFHQQYGWTEAPGSEYYEWRNDEWFHHTYDNNGMRITPRKGNDTIFVVGDSFVRGTLANDEETIPYLIDSWLLDTKVESLAAGGWGTSQQLLAYQSEGKQIEHKAVILVMYLGNDFFNNNSRTGLGVKRPMFGIVNGKLVQIVKPEKAIPIRGWMAYQEDESIHQWLSKRFLLYRLVSNAPQYFGTKRESIFETFSEDEVAQQIKITIGILSEFYEKVKENNAELIIVALPSRAEVHKLEPVEYPFEIGKKYWEALRESLELFIQHRADARIFYLDMLPHLIKATEEGLRLYGRPDGHLNVAGYRLVANHIVEILRHNKIIKQETVKFDSMTREARRFRPRCKD